MKHQRWRFELPSRWEDLLSGELWNLGCTGIQVDSSRGATFAETTPPGPDETIHLEAWLPDPLPDSAAAFDFSTWKDRAVHLVDSEIVAEQDWLASYRESVEPFDVGRRFRVDPGNAEPEGGSPVEEESLGERILLRIPAQTAFGTGSHESTRLMIQLLEALPLFGRRVLDVGTGSGILALVCRHLGASQVMGFDLDPAAPLVARRNDRLDAERSDQLGERGPRSRSCAFFAGTAAALRAEARFDLLLINVLPERIEGDLPRLVDCLETGGLLVSSGNLLERRGELLERFAALGLREISAAVDGEWVAFVLEKCQPSS